MRQLHNQQNNAGFTLVEMLVSLSLFTVVLTMSVGTLLVLIDANGRAQNMQLIMTNFSFALDSMTREIRTSTDWYCGHQSGSNEPVIPTDTVDSSNATNNCGLSGHNGNYISVIETGGSLTGSPSGPGPYGTLNSNRITYFYDDDYYASEGGGGAILRSLGGNNSGPEINWVPLTGPEIDIEFIDISVSGTDRYKTNGNTIQPTMTLYIRGVAGNDGQKKEFSLQTSVTQRSLDL